MEETARISDLAALTAARRCESVISNEGRSHATIVGTSGSRCLCPRPRNDVASGGAGKDWLGYGNEFGNEFDVAFVNLNRHLARASLSGRETVSGFEVVSGSLSADTLIGDTKTMTSKGRASTMGSGSITSRDEAETTFSRGIS